MGARGGAAVVICNQDVRLVHVGGSAAVVMCSQGAQCVRVACALVKAALLGFVVMLCSSRALKMALLLGLAVNGVQFAGIGDDAAIGTCSQSDLSVASPRVMSCHVMSSHVTSRRVTRVASYRVMSYHVMSCYVISCRVASRCVMLCYVPLCRVVLCLVASCRLMLVKRAAAALPANAPLRFM